MTNNDTPDKDCLDPEINSKCCFFKVANAFLLIFVFLLSIVLAIYAPRVIRGNNLGFDYMGVIIAVLAILVTLLVGWNIFSTIKAKEELSKAIHDIDSLKHISEKEIKQVSEAMQKIPEEKFSEIKQALSSLQIKNSELEASIEQARKEAFAIGKRAEMKALMANAIYQYGVAERGTEKFEKSAYIRAYSDFVKALILSFETNSPNSDVRKCLDYIDRCLAGMVNSGITFDEQTYNECDKILASTLDSKKFNISERNAFRVSAIRAHQEDVSFKTLQESIYDYALSVLRPVSKSDGDDKSDKGDNKPDPNKQATEEQPKNTVK